MTPEGFARLRRVFFNREKFTTDTCGGDRNPSIFGTMKDVRG